MLKAQIFRTAIRNTSFACLGLLGACVTAPDAPDADASAPVNLGPVIKAGDLAGASTDKLQEILGAPDLVRREGDGEYRRYAFDGCNLIVILYPNDKGEEETVHLDATAATSGANKPDVDECLASRR